MKTILEIQALQSFGGSSNNVSSLSDSNNSLFTQLLDELMPSTTSSLTNNAENLLGNFSNQQSLSVTSSSSNSSNYLASLLYNNDSSYIPSSFYNLLTQSQVNSDSVLNNYHNKDYTGKTAYENVLAGASQFADIIAKASEKYGVPEKLIAAVMKQESNFNANAVSYAGATGLMQLMPGTARYLGVIDAKNPEQNIMGGAKYLGQLLKKFDSNIQLALAAYNAGPGNVSKYGGIPPFKETKNYVQKVLNYYQS